MIKIEINIVPKFIDKAISPIAESIGTTLDSVWTLAFGGVDIYVQKTQLKRVHALNKFKEELEQKVSAVPPEKLIEPPLHIIGPTLEASKFYFEDDDLRSMFSNLIAASINEDTIKKTHPSFVEIIKQLSPIDASNLEYFKKSQRHPICKYDVLMDNGGTVGYLSNIFLENERTNKSYTDIKLTASSLTNLNRLGLVIIDYDSYLSEEEEYQKFLNHSIYLNAVQELEDDPTRSIKLRKGIVDISPFGKDFIEICL